nr:MAG TPA: hypothetical protein [Caudoviricetes sp.]
MEIDKFIQFLGGIKDREVKRLCKKAMQKGRNKATAEVRKQARTTAKSRNNGHGKSYLRTYKGGKIVQVDNTWKTRAYNKNGKAHFLEKPTFSKYHKQGLNAFEKSQDKADKAFIQAVNEAFDELIKKF